MKPLERIRILTLEQFSAALHEKMSLAAMGGEFTKIENGNDAVLGLLFPKAARQR
jgi:hypothetical protein